MFGTKSINNNDIKIEDLWLYEKHKSFMQSGGGIPVAIDDNEGAALEIKVLDKLCKDGIATRQKVKLGETYWLYTAKQKYKAAS